jgi:molybdopterin biosynthesis enzyme
MAPINERPYRLAMESPARAGDRVLAGGKVHRVERASYMLTGWVRTLCGQIVRYQVAGDEPSRVRRRCASFGAQVGAQAGEQ